MWTKLKRSLINAKIELKAWWYILRDSRTPGWAKALLIFAAGYAATPFDFIVDVIPGLGALDDFIVAGLAIWISLKIIPKNVVEDCRLRARYK